MWKKIIAGVLSAVLVSGSIGFSETEIVHGANLSIEQQLEQEYRETEEELCSSSDEDIREEYAVPLSEEEIQFNDSDFFDGMEETAVFSDGQETLFTDSEFDEPESPSDPADPTDPEEPYDPEDPEEPEDPEDPDEPGEPVDPEAPINPEEPYDPEIPEGVTEVTLEAEEGEDIAWKLNGLLIKMSERATDEVPCKVIIPPGNYTITKTICTYSNLHIYAVGAVITKVSPEKNMLLRLGNKVGSEGGYKGYRNVTIEGGTWDINYESIPDKEEKGGCTGFRLGHAENVVIRNVTIRNNLKSHLIELAGVKGAKITGCTLSGYWEGYTGGAQECIQLDICHERYFPSYSPSDRSVCEDIYIEGNTFENAFAGVGCHSMSFNRPFKNIVIRKNTFTNIRKRAVWLTNSLNSIVENNKMLQVGGGVYVRSMYSHCAYINEGQQASGKDNQYPLNLTIKNNEITLNPQSAIGSVVWKPFGIYITGENCVSAENQIPDGAYPIKKAAVTDNKISGPGNGIQCGLAEECTISNNVLKLNDAGETRNLGVIVGGSSSCKVTGNKVSGNSGPGIYIYRGSSSYARPGKKNIISGNTVGGCAGDGITVSRTCDSAVVEKNTVSGKTENGIFIWKNTGASVKNNTVSGSSLDGILLSGTKKATVTQNTVSSCGENGIRTEEGNTGLTVSKNTSKKNKRNGYVIGGSTSPIVIENIAEKNEKSGIHVLGSGSVRLLKNKMTGNKGYGIYGTDSSITVFKSNSLKKNGHFDTIYLVNASLPY